MEDYQKVKRMVWLGIEASITDLNQGKVRVELRHRGDTQPFYTSPFLTAPFYARMLKEKPFLAFIEIKKYTITAKVVELQSEAVVIEWSYAGPETFQETEVHHPFLWQAAIQNATGSVTE